ncbi:hypothetical protein H4582DRAFT_2056880 [Lactarius indigo]|nr:hypothetical protein H4582DRAFT_2056880 [Lactarius indigo]
MGSAVDINNAALPTLERLGVSAPHDVDAGIVAQTLFGAFSNQVQTGDVDGILGRLVDDAFCFPPTWPVFAPAPKAADWLENYTHGLELDVWTSSKEGFNGTILHSGHYTKGSDYKGEKVVVVGAAASGHDIAKDVHDHGADVTMFQRSSTYVVSVKHGVTAVFGDIAEKDRETLDGLRRVGFRLNTGIDGTGFILLVTVIRNTDVGASQLIIDGKIKLKNDSQISRFTKNGLEFADGSTLDADAVVFATGCQVCVLIVIDA